METFAEFYRSSDYAEFDQSVRRGGTFGLSLLDVKQGAIETVDPAIPEVPFVAGVTGGGPAEIDFGDGWRRHDLKPGFMDIQPPNQSCGFRIPGLHLRIVFCPEQRLVELLDEYGLTLHALGASTGHFRQSKSAVALIHAMWRTARVEDPANHLLLDGLWMQLLAGIIHENQLLRRDLSGTAIGDHRLNRVLDFVEAHLDQPLCVADLASVACLSNTQFGRSFKAAMKQTPAQYVLERRCARARHLLLHSSLSMESIAAACGFQNRSYFSTAFFRVMGVSPSKMRAHAASD